MYSVTLETDLRSSTAALPRGGAGNGDFFAELLRQHSDARDPSSARRRDDPRDVPDQGRRRRATEGLDSHTRPDLQATHDDVPPNDDGGAPRNADATPVDRRADTPDEPHHADAVADDTGGSPVQVAAAPVNAPAAAAGNATVTSDAAPVSAVAATPAAPARSNGAAAPTPADLPATAASPVATPNEPAADGAEQMAAPPAPGNASPASAQPAPVVAAAATIASQSQPGAAPDMASRVRSAATAANPVQAAGDGAKLMSSTGDLGADMPADVAIAAERPATVVTAKAQGLGKLGSGADVALTAQAAGETIRNVANPGKNNGATPPQVGAPGQQTSGAPAGTSAAPTSTATPAASAAPAPAVNQAAAAAQQQPAGTPVASVFQTVLDGTTATPDGAPGASAGPVAGSGHHATGLAGGSAATQTRPALPGGSPAEQIGVHIQRAVREGNSRITVQLNPAELGHVEIRLDFAKDGSVSASILADRRDTLDMLQRDARLLERSLQDAGLQTNGGSLSFDLRDGGRHGFGSQTQAFDHGDEGGHRRAPGSDGETSTGNEQAVSQRTGIRDSGVDIHV